MKTDATSPQAMDSYQPTTSITINAPSTPTERVSLSLLSPGNQPYSRLESPISLTESPTTVSLELPKRDSLEQNNMRRNIQRLSGAMGRHEAPDDGSSKTARITCAIAFFGLGGFGALGWVLYDRSHT